MTKKRRVWWRHFSETTFLEYQPPYMKMDGIFWNPEIKLDKIGMFLYVNIEFKNLTKFDLV